jgi:hypothetical protein
MRAFFYTPLASGTVAFDNVNDFIPAFYVSVYAAYNPQQKHNSQNNIYNVHFYIKITAQKYCRASRRTMDRNG